MKLRTLVAVVWVSLAAGQTPDADAAKRQAILDYQLTLKRTNQLITAMQAMSRYIVSLPDFQERLRKAATMTIEEQAAKIESDPKASSIVKCNQV